MTALFAYYGKSLELAVSEVTRRCTQSSDDKNCPFAVTAEQGEGDVSHLVGIEALNKRHREDGKARRTFRSAVIANLPYTVVRREMWFP